jgi:hypothetical protein
MADIVMVVMALIAMEAITLVETTVKVAIMKDMDVAIVA